MVEHFARRTAVQAYARENIIAYSYRFNILPAGSPAATGVTHYQEVAWVFDNIDGRGYSTNPFNGSLVHRDAYVQVSTLMNRMWTSFATDVDPNNNGLTGYPHWPAYSLEGGGVWDNLVFDADVTLYVERDNRRVPGMESIASKARSQWKF